MKRAVICLLFSFVIAQTLRAGEKEKNQQQETPLDEFLNHARQSGSTDAATGPSLFSPSAPNLFLFRDVKARSANDIITIQIIENATATNSANTSTKKSGDATIAAPNLFGLEKSTSALNFAKLLQSSSGLNFEGQGSTSRSGQLQAWLTARVVEVLPNGDLVIEGTKDVTINREHQSLTVRGVVRQRDVNPNNVVMSTAIAHMEVKFDGKGIVSNANKPGFLYWLFSKVTPF
jgi:flagellar L-ring protein precursor FlgH